MITDAQKALLKACGYSVEDMSSYGPDWEGQWRFLSTDDFGVPMYSEEAAWADAFQYRIQLVVMDFDEAYKRMLHRLIFFTKSVGEIFVTDDFGDLIEVVSDRQLDSILHFISQKEISLQ